MVDDVMSLHLNIAKGNQNVTWFGFGLNTLLESIVEEWLTCYQSVFMKLLQMERHIDLVCTYNTDHGNNFDLHHTTHTY